MGHGVPCIFGETDRFVLHVPSAGGRVVSQQVGLPRVHGLSLRAVSIERQRHLDLELGDRGR
jgi:hypothetical protein